MKLVSTSKGVQLVIVYCSPEHTSNVLHKLELIVNQPGTKCELISKGYFNINWIDGKTYSIKHLFVRWGLSHLINDPANLNNLPGKHSLIHKALISHQDSSH